MQENLKLSLSLSLSLIFGLFNLFNRLLIILVLLGSVGADLLLETVVLLEELLRSRLVSAVVVRADEKHLLAYPRFCLVCILNAFSYSFLSLSLFFSLHPSSSLSDSMA